MWGNVTVPESVLTVDEVVEAYVAAHAALDPVGATRQGIAGHEHEMTELGPMGLADPARHLEHC